MSTLKKLMAMAIFAAWGASIGAIVGEVLFLAEPAAGRSICLLFDVSGSMNDRVRSESSRRGPTQLEALKRAAADFIARQNLAADALGLAVFSSRARVVCPLGRDGASLGGALTELDANGGTDLGLGLDVATSALDGRPGQRWILLFSDGKPESTSTSESPQQSALSAAARARAAGINIVAIGTRLADPGLLAEATGSAASVIISDPRKLADAFRRSEALINRQMLSSRAISAGYRENATRAGIWACLIAIGAGAGLVAAQNRHLRRRTLTIGAGLIILAGGLFTGAASGTAGQSVFYALAGDPIADAIARVLAWGLLGAGLGLGCSVFVPNLDRRKAALAGTAGGVAAAIVFLTIVPMLGDTLGRVLAAAILGAALALAIVLVEVVARSAWLVVHWSERERSTLSLGPRPILVGSSPEAHVLLPDDDHSPPLAARIVMTDGVIRCEDVPSGTTRALRAGEVLRFGAVRVEVRTG